jgi:hypothetical protein
MSKTISNTLTRWHKVAERIKGATTELMQANVAVLSTGHQIDGDTFTVRKTTLKAESENALVAKTSLYFSLLDALFAIRKSLAHANTSEGVSDRLNEMEAAKQKGTYYAALLETADGALSVDEFAALAAKRSGSSGHSMYGVNVTFMSAEQKAVLTEKRDAARREVNALADRLADANATKLSLTLSDEVVAFLGL